MAVLRSPRKTARRVSEPMGQVMPQNLGYSMMPQKSLLERMAPILLGVIVVMAFAMGTMWSKLNGQPTTGAVAGKYKNLDAAFADYAKLVKADTKKLAACLKDGTKKSIVDADLAEGQGLGVQGTPGFFVNGMFVGGAFPYATFKELIDLELAGKSSEVLTAYSAELQGAASGGAFDPKKKTVNVGSSAARGDGSVTIVEYSDFQCPFCKQAKLTIDQVLKDYSGKVKLVYKHYPLDQIHPNARRAAEASACVGDSGKFWEFHDMLFDKQAEWSNLPQV